MKKEVATEPPMDLIRNLFDSTMTTAPRSSNKAVSLSLKHCGGPGSVMGMLQVCCAYGFRFTSHFGNLRFRIVTGGCTFQFMGPVFHFFCKTS